jgi:hypothetical protein
MENKTFAGAVPGDAWPAVEPLDPTAEAWLTMSRLHARQSDVQAQGAGRKEPGIVQPPDISTIGEHPSRIMLALCGAKMAGEQRLSD